MSQFKQFQFNSDAKYKPSLKAHFIILLITLLVAFIAFYITLPALSIYSFASWITVSFYVLLFVGLEFLVFHRLVLAVKYLAYISVAMVIVGVVLNVASSEMFNAKRYRDQMQVQESSFTDSITSISLNEIPIVDKASARQLGDKQIGMVTGLGSQYNIDPIYTLIIQNDTLYRVSPLEYEDFFKWFENRDKGIPGYIKVNVNDPSDVQLVTLDEGIRYSPGAFFGDNLQRHVRFQYPSAIVQGYSFELDDNDNPYWVLPVLKPEIGMYGGLDSAGVIIVDPHSGDSNYYDLDDVPDWVDNVHSIDIAWSQIDNWGYYTNGFFNTLFSKKDMIQTTDQYNFVSIDNQLHMFSSLTSVGSDNSIVGFALINIRTKEATFIQVGGADEDSAKKSAQGQVQHLNYIATDPILLNIGDIPTYFVGLKDQEGLVKMYSFVSVQDYAIVGVGNTVEEGRIDYLNKVNAASNNNANLVLTTDSGTVTTITEAIVEGQSVYYLTLDNSDKLFIAPISLSDELPLTKVGSKVKVEYLDTQQTKINVTKFDNLDYNY